MADGFDFGPAKTQIPTATTSEDGLMSAEDKTLLNTLNTQIGKLGLCERICRTGFSAANTYEEFQLLNSTDKYLFIAVCFSWADNAPTQSMIFPSVAWTSPNTEYTLNDMVTFKCTSTTAITAKTTNTVGRAYVYGICKIA